MALLRLRYVHSFVDKKTGRVYFYFRHRGERWALPGMPGTTEFTAAYDALLQRLVVGRGASFAFAPKTLGAVIEQYIASGAFTSKAPHTRRVYRHILDRIKEIAGRGLIVDLQEKHVRLLRQRFLPAKSVADEAVMLLGMLWVFAKENLATQLGPNPTTDVRRLHKRKPV
jgi:hypothetical protein